MIDLLREDDVLENADLKHADNKVSLENVEA